MKHLRPKETENAPQTSTRRTSRGHRRAGSEDRGRGEGRLTWPRAGREDCGRGRGRHTWTGSPPPDLAPGWCVADAWAFSAPAIRCQPRRGSHAPGEAPTRGSRYRWAADPWEASPRPSPCPTSARCAAWNGADPHKKRTKDREPITPQALPRRAAVTRSARRGVGRRGTTYAGAGQISALLLRSEALSSGRECLAVSPFSTVRRSVRASARLAQAVSSGLERTSANSAELHVTRITNRIPHEQRRWPREGSNLRTRIRSPPLYPLSYGARVRV